MNRLDIQLQNSSTSISPVSHLDLGPAHRLIVLVPDADLDYAAATRRVWQLANDLGANIQFIGLYKDISHESSLRRQLVTMSAMVQDGKVTAEAKVEIGNNWVNVVKSNWQAGDVIVCFTEQRAGLLHRPLSQILRSNLEAPIYILSGLYPQSQSRFNMLSFIALWAGFIGIIASSFLLQIQLVALLQDWTQTILLILSVMAEFWLIWVWNNLFS
ncbi:MAG: hypothetical protein L0287_01335 [Anaerolineae bacterium]|nr:hypothetical protein [Anaerolineae bacterium]MCI0610581.1 hypothetical protein [Anaerolineae bacterium]